MMVLLRKKCVQIHILLFKNQLTQLSFLLPTMNMSGTVDLVLFKASSIQFLQQDFIGNESEPNL